MKKNDINVRYAVDTMMYSSVEKMMAGANKKGVNAEKLEQQLFQKADEVERKIGELQSAWSSLRNAEKTIKEKYGLSSTQMPARRAKLLEKLKGIK